MTNDKKNGAFINHYPKGMVHFQDYVNSKGEPGTLASVTIDCPQSKTGKATIAVNLGQLLPAKKRNRQTGKKYVVKNRWNIFLGDKDELRDVSIALNNAKKKENRKYQTIQMTNAQIEAMVTTARELYAEEHAA